MSDFDGLRDHVAEARQALAGVRAPLPEDSANPYAALYYPLLFLAETGAGVLRHVLREAHESVKDENEGGAAFLSRVPRVTR